MRTTKAPTGYISLSVVSHEAIDTLREESRRVIHEDPPLHFAIGQLLEAHIVEVHRLANRLVDQNLVSCQSAGIEVALTLAKYVQGLEKKLTP